MFDQTVKNDTGAALDRRSHTIVEIFKEGDPATTLAAMSRTRELDALVPGFADKRNLLQDERWHGGLPVADHMIESVVSAQVILADRHFTYPSMRTLVLMAAFFQDYGKLPPEGARSELEAETRGKAGRQDICSVPNDEFRKVRYFGHPGVGAKLFSELFKTPEQNISQHQPALSRSEVEFVSHLIRHHMRALEGLRAMATNPVEEIAEAIAREIYPVTLQNAGIPPSDAFQAYLIMQEIEIRCGEPRLHLNGDDPRLSAYQREWEGQMRGWPTLLGELGRLLPLLEREAKERLSVPLLSGKDLFKLGCNRDVVEPIRKRVWNDQIDGHIVTRLGAITAAAEFASELGCPLDQSKVSEILGGTGYRALCTRLEHVRCLPVENRGTYVVKRFIASPIQQLKDDFTAEDLRRQLVSGNFPRLAEHAHRNYPDLEPLRSLLAKKFANLLQAEAFLTAYGVDGERLENIEQTFSPITRSIEIRRQGGPRPIVLRNGYQGIEDHTGAGGIHLVDQRREKLLQFFSRPGELESAMERRFLDDGIIHVAGTGTLRIPSHLDPERFELLAGTIEGDSSQAVVLILDRSSGTDSVVTALFCEKPAEIRRTFVAALADLQHKFLQQAAQRELYQHSILSPEIICEMMNDFLEKTNQFLLQTGATPILPIDLEQRLSRKNKIRDTTGTAPKKEVLAVAGRPLSGADYLSAGVSRRQIPDFMKALGKETHKTHLDDASRDAILTLVRKMVADSASIEDITACVRAALPAASNR